MKEPTEIRLPGVWKAAISVIGTIALAAFVWVWNADRTIVKLELAIKQINEAAEDTDDDVKRDTTIMNHWRLHNWARDQFSTLRAKHDLDVVPWPELK